MNASLLSRPGPSFQPSPASPQRRGLMDILAEMEAESLARMQAPAEPVPSPVRDGRSTFEPPARPPPVVLAPVAAPAAPARAAAPVAASGTPAVSHPWLRTLATAHLRNGPDGSCVATTLGNLDRLGIPSFAGGTSADPNNARGAMVQMVRNGHWTSLQLPGAQQRTIRSAYGTAQAWVLNADAYERLARAGQIPSGAVLFQTRHGWDSPNGPRGNDMGIVRDGGRVTHNYRDMSPVIYRDAREVVVLVPRGAQRGA